MHPCREYWGQDVAYGSLVAGEKPRRGMRASALTEVWILDLRAAARAASHADLAGVLGRIGGFGIGEESLRQSAAHLKTFLATEPAPPPALTSIERAFRGDVADGNQNILGIATLHRTRMLLSGSCCAADVPSKAARYESPALLCAEFMRHLGELGADDGVARIDWVMVRASDRADRARSHLWATRVARLPLTRFAPGEASHEATAVAPSARTSHESRSDLALALAGAERFSVHGLGARESGAARLECADDLDVSFFNSNLQRLRTVAPAKPGVGAEVC